MPKTKTLLITGGTGFVGRSLLRMFKESVAADTCDIKITVISRNPDQFLSKFPEFSELPWLKFITGNILDPACLQRLDSFDLIIHAAASTSPMTDSDLLNRFDEITEGTRNLLEYAASHNTNRFLFISSGAVYGRQLFHLEKIPEEGFGTPDPLNPLNAYAIAKLTAEHLCALFAQTYGLHTVIARCFAFIGPDLPILNTHLAIGNFVRDALLNDEIIVYSNGMQVRSYLFQKDLANWLMTLLINGKSGAAYNVGSDYAITIADLACLVRDLVAPSKPVRILGTSDKGMGHNCYVPDISTARQEFALDVFTPLDKAIIETADTLRLRWKSEHQHNVFTKKWS